MILSVTHHNVIHHSEMADIFIERVPIDDRYPEDHWYSYGDQYQGVSAERYVWIASTNATYRS